MAELERLEEHRARIEDWLHACFQDCAPRGNLYDAMRYSLLAGGKRSGPCCCWRPAACAAERWRMPCPLPGRLRWFTPTP